MSHNRLLAFLSVFTSNPYLCAVRDGLTHTLPVIVAGTFAILLNSFPLPVYQELMGSFFGEHWKLFGGYIYNGTFGLLSIIMALSIGHSLCEDYNSHYPLDRLTPAIFSFVVFSSVMATMEPVSAGTAFEMRWLGVHGLLLAIISAVFSSYLFRFFLRIDCLRISVHAGSNSMAINQALAAMFPAVLTISVFAGYKASMYFYGIPSPNEAIYKLLTQSFSSLGGQSLSTANFYGFIRHFLWFFGIHGSNVLEPIMQEVYVSALKLNIELKQAGVIDSRVFGSIFQTFQKGDSPYAIFTKPFFDCYSSMGGAGCTFGLFIACLLRHKSASARKVARISILPSLFNINEILLFGLPVVLNPVFLIPFVFVPIATTTVAYFAVVWGLVPPTTHEVAWNIPIFINAYMATGSINAILLQLVNLCIATFIYIPFVKIDNELRDRSFKQNFRDLLDASIEEESHAGPKLIARQDAVGTLAASFALELSGALKRREFYLEYQPQVNSDNGRVYGVEALMRWHHPQIGRIPPPIFITIAEDTGFISKLGDWALEESIRQISEWRKAGIADVLMSVNVSVLQLEDPKFPERVIALLAKYELPKEFLKLELTESIALTQEMTQNLVLESLHKLGIPLAIDDFGMGHSSVVYLQQFPVSSLKIDAILSRDVLVSNSSCEIITTVVKLCKRLNIGVVVEFVEDEEHLLKLRSLGCANIQGFFYSRSLPPEECLRFIKKVHSAYAE